MKGRRPLVAGIQANSEVKDLERAFVFGSRNEPSQPMVAETEVVEEQQPEPAVSQSTENAVVEQVAIEPAQHTPEQPAKNATVPNDRVQPQVTGRVPITTRTRPEVASALKKASLQRQMAGVEPCYVQDIMEEALVTWLSAKGYL